MSEEKRSSTLEQAIEFALRNWRVLPLAENGKTPVMTDWPTNATTDIERIEGFFEHSPNRGYGIVTGKESCTVLDVDVKNGQLGLESLNKLFTEEELKAFVLVRTPSGGLHIYFQGDEVTRNEQGFMPGLDIRANGGFIVGSGTQIDGREYEHVQGEFDDLPPVPLKLIEAIQSSKKEKRQLVKRMLEGDADGLIPEGQRNQTLFRIAAEIRDDFRSFEYALWEMERINEERCDPPVDTDELERLVESAYSYKPNILEFIDRFPTTEIGLSNILLHFHEGDIIYVPEFKKFALWDEYLWGLDESLQVESVVKFITEMFAQAVEAAKDRLYQVKELNPEDEIAIEYWKGMIQRYSGQEKKSGSRAGMKNILEIVRSEIVVNQCQLDKDDFKFGVLNGVVNLKRGDLLPEPLREDYMTMRGLVEFDPKAECPLWLGFLETCTQGDKELQTFLKRVVGYSLTGSTREQMFFFLFGFGANGKSTFMNIVQMLLGDYYRSIPSSALMVKKNGGGNGPSPEIAMLRGKRLAVASELEEGERLSESLVKMMTGGDQMPARHLYGEYFEFEPKFTLFMVGNHRPHIQGGDHGIWRRICLIPFNHSVPENERDPYLEEKLKGELAGILNWAIEGCLEWQKEGLDLPNAVKQETNEYRDSEDIMKRFFNDCCTLGDCYGEYQKRLYEKYRDWAKEGNEWEMSNKAFGNKLKEQPGLVMERKSSGNYWVGITVGNFRPDEPTSYVEGDDRDGVIVEGEEDEGSKYTI